MIERGYESRGAGRGNGNGPSHPALTDELTGLPNRLHFEVIFKMAFEMGDRGVPLTLLTMALDAFGEYEEGHGKDAAAEALRDFGVTLAEHIRKTDLLARTDWGRFDVLLLDSNLQGGLLAADRFEDLLIDFKDRTGLTFSVGVASYERGMTEPQQLEANAGKALKVAQDAGGDTVKIPADAKD